jgi:outer membrane protein TolC
MWIVMLLTLTAGLPARADTAATAPEVLSLEDAVALALRNNRNVASATISVERAEQKVGAARARRLPSLEVQAQAGTTLTPIRVSFPEGSFGTFPATGPIPSEDTVVETPRSVTGLINASLAQPITQLHKIGLNTKLSELARDVEKEKLREQRSALVADVRTLYYQLLQAQSALQAKQEQVQVYRELDRVVGEQVSLEVALRSDGLQVKSRLAGQEYELAALRGDLTTAKEKMNLLLGRDLGQEFDVVAVPESTIEEVDLRSAVAGALERRPDLAQARLAVEQADTDRRIKKAEMIPDVSLAVSYYSFMNVDLLPRNIAQVGVQVKWEPFDWGRRGKERAEKTLQVEQARTSAREAADRARLDVSQRFRKLQEARLLIVAQRLGRDAAQENLRVLMARHRQESSLLKDVLEAQASMSGAHAEYDRALLTFWTAKADFQKAIGQEQ